MTIYIPKSPSKVEQNAAAELALYLQKACGTEFPVLPEEDSACGIYVGFTDFAASHGIAALAEGQCGRNSLNGVEAWVVQAADGSLVLTGGKKNTDRGILYAVEHYLEEVLGVRFWNALEEYVPAIDCFTMDPNLSLRGEPEAGNGFSTRMQLDRAPDYIRDVSGMKHKGEEGTQFTMTLRHNGSRMGRVFTFEDVKPGEYALYHLFDLDDLSEESNSLLFLTRGGFVPHISGFAQVLGTGKVSIWARIKFTGTAYGGDASEPDAVWFDRLFFVPRD